MAVFLCGFMGCGKTTVGKRLAQKTGVSYCDMDELIVKEAGMTIPEIFDRFGEAEFRRMETELILRLRESEGIVSCGGGAMLKDENSEIAREKGTVVFLDVPFEVCYERIKGDKNRPLAVSRTKEELLSLYNERYPKYKGNSDLAVLCDGTPEEISGKIAALLK